MFLFGRAAADCGTTQNWSMSLFQNLDCVCNVHGMVAIQSFYGASCVLHIVMNLVSGIWRTIPITKANNMTKTTAQTMHNQIRRLPASGFLCCQLNKFESSLVDSGLVADNDESPNEHC